MDQDLIGSSSVLDMLTVANEFCIFTENVDKYELTDVLSYYSKVCPLLYLKGALLPTIEPDEDFPGERFVNEEQWEVVFNLLRAKLGEKDEFLSVSDDFIAGKTVNTSISECLADTYQDLKDFVLLFQKNLSYQKINAISECQILFVTHWGFRISTMMPALHKIAFVSESETDLF